MINRRSIAGNSFWYGLESVIDASVSLAMSVAVARIIGPQRLGYFIYLTFLVNFAARMGGSGPGSATRKYLSEYLGRDEPGMARSVFFTMLKWHTGIGFLMAFIGWGLTFAFGDPDQRLVACIMVASLIASVVNAVPSQANMAAQNFALNVPASLTSLLAYVIIVVLTLLLNWGLVGLAAAMFVRRTLEMLMRLVPAMKWARQLPKQKVTGSMARQLMTFSGQSLAIALLLIVVWDRSELLFLKRFCQIQEVTFYSVAFSITESLLMLPNVIGAAVSARLMVDYGRTRESIAPLASTSIRYLALLVFPAYIGLAALSEPIVRVVYGQSYLPAIPVVAISLILAVPKAFYWFPSAMLQAADRQSVMFRWLLALAFFNIGIDLALIPRFGAVGAAVGNGIAQAAAVFILMIVAARVCQIPLPWASLTKTLCLSLIMGGIVSFAVKPLPPAAALVLGPVLGVLVYLTLLRLTRSITSNDLARIRDFESRLPASLRRLCWSLLEWLAGRQAVEEPSPMEVVAP